MKKVLFLIPELCLGGTSTVLINLIENINTEKFDITIMTLFGNGENEDTIKEITKKKPIRYISLFKKAFRGNSYFFRIIPPEILHRIFIKEKYDIEIAFQCHFSTRLISGCVNTDTKLISWVHGTYKNSDELSVYFKNYKEMLDCLNKYNEHYFVSDESLKAFSSLFLLNGAYKVLYNVNSEKKILEAAKEEIDIAHSKTNQFQICSVGRLDGIKSFERLIDVHKKLLNHGYDVHTYIIGEGKERTRLEKQISDYKLNDSVTLLGYQSNPHKYVSKFNLFVCSSWSEGFSTATMEALVVGTPVCTVSCGGMTEMLGKNNEYGLITKKQHG